MSDSGFIHLSVHSEYSLVDSVVRIDALVEAAAAAGMPAVALTDRGNLFGLVKFYRAALARGLKPIVGAELWVAMAAAPEEPGRLILLCRDLAGYRNLSALLSRAWAEGQRKGVPLLHEAWLEPAAAAGLIALAPVRDGPLAGLPPGPGRAAAAVACLRQAFGEWLFLEIQRTGRQHDEVDLAAAVAHAQHFDIPLVASNEVRFLREADFDAHEARVCIQQGRTLADPARPRHYSREQYLRTPAEMRALFADLPEALDNTIAIATCCNLNLELGQTHLPDYPAAGEAGPDACLRGQASEGLARCLAGHDRRQANAAAYQVRLDQELDVICRMGFAGYFLIVADFIEWAKRNDVPVGPGRGSGAGSLVAWVLGITDLDPLEHSLLFERFLNPERVSMPDFDVDFCMEGRDRVIDYVTATYGRDRVSQIITYGTMAARAVVRDVGRVLGYPYGFVDRIAKLIPNEPGAEITLDIALGREPEFAELYRQDDEVRGLVDLARQLEGLVRNAGRHAGGIVIAPRRITDFTPLYCVEGESSTVTQFDKDDVEAAGLVKFDFLGLRTLTIIDAAVRTINAQRAAAGQPMLDIRAIPMDDAASFALLKSCRTTAVFQLESRGMRDLIRRLQPDSFEDIVALVALFRPGPLQSGMVDDFISRKHGKPDAPIDYLHPDLEPVLRATYGVILYQEQVMQIAQRLAGYSLGEADLLRRAMGKKKPEEMAKQRSVFVDGAAARGVERSRATMIFDLMEKFAGYGFNKSHSAAYALLAYQTAWLKANHPAAFMASVMTSEMGNTDQLLVLRRECADMGIEIEPPDINASRYRFTVTAPSRIRYGLGALKGVGQGAAEHVVALREAGGPYRGLHDFCQRVFGLKLGRRPIEALIKAGAMDGFGHHRPSLLAALPQALGAAEQAAVARSAGQDDMFGGGEVAAPVAGDVVPVDDWGWGQRLAAERESLGLYLSGHPLDAYRADQPFIASSALAALASEPPPPPGEFRGGGRQVSVAGLVSAVRKRGSRVSIELDDGSGVIEVGFFGEVYTQYRHLLGSHALVVVNGLLRHDEFTNGWRLTAREVLDVDQLVGTRASGLVLRWHADDNPRLSPSLLREVLEPYRPGACRVAVLYSRNGTQARVNLGADWSVRPERGLRERLSALVGLDGFRFIYVPAGS